MTNRTAKFLHYSLVLLTLVLFPNANQVLCNGDVIIERATLVTRLDRLPLPSNAVGPETTAFDATGTGPYVGVSNGRVLKWSSPSIGFVDFAVTSQNWSRQACESSDTSLEPVCGRPLGMEFYKKKGILYIGDAYNNLRSVDLNGGIATLVASSAEGVPFKFTNAVDVDQQTGLVYFTDASSRFQRKDVEEALQSGDMSGRLMMYNPTTKQVTVLLRNLAFAAGVAVSKDGEFVIVSEFSKSRILRFWLKGPKANTSEIFVTFPEGGVDNIRRNANGDFWVALSIGTLQNAIPLGILIGRNGQVLRTLNFSTSDVSVPVSNVQEYNRKLYVGFLSLDYVGVTRTTRG